MRITDTLTLYETALFLLGLNEEENEDEREIECKLEEEFGMNFSQLADVLGKLLLAIDVGRSPLTGKLYKGFANGGCWLAKVEIKKGVRSPYSQA